MAVNDFQPKKRLSDSQLKISYLFPLSPSLRRSSFPLSPSTGRNCYRTKQILRSKFVLFSLVKSLEREREREVRFGLPCTHWSNSKNPFNPTPSEPGITSHLTWATSCRLHLGDLPSQQVINQIHFQSLIGSHSLHLHTYSDLVRAILLVDSCILSSLKYKTKLDI